MQTRSNTEIVIETLQGNRRTKVWNPRRGGVFVVIDSAGVELAKLTVRRTKRVRDYSRRARRATNS